MDMPCLNEFLWARGCCLHLGVVAKCGQLLDLTGIPSHMALMRQAFELVWLFNFDS